MGFIAACNKMVQHYLNTSHRFNRNVPRSLWQSWPGTYQDYADEKAQYYKGKADGWKEARELFVNSKKREGQ